MIVARLLFRLLLVPFAAITAMIPPRLT